MELPNLVEMSATTIQEAYNEWMQKNPPEKIKQDCLRTLDKSSEEILRKLLGFNKDSWGGWSLDHCNGRAGESTAGKYIRDTQITAVNKWLSQVDLPSMNAQMKKSMQAYAKEYFEREFNEQLRAKVKDYAKEQANTFFDTLVKTQSKQVENQLKVLELLLQTNKGQP